MPPAVRPLAANDYDAWLPLWTSYQTFYKAEIPEAVSRESFRRMLAPGEPTFGALATEDSRAIGLVHWILHRTNWSIADNCYLQDLYVNEDTRGLGIGRLLIEHVYAAARQANCNCVYWLTHQTNATARRLYDRIAQRSGFLHYKKEL